MRFECGNVGRLLAAAQEPSELQAWLHRPRVLVVCSAMQTQKVLEELICDKESQDTAIRGYRASALSSCFKTIGSCPELNNNIFLFKVIEMILSFDQDWLSRTYQGGSISLNISVLVG